MESQYFYKYFYYIFNIINIINFLCIGIWEIITIFKFQKIILENENNAYNFTFACSTINIINSFALLYLLFNKFIVNNYIILFIINIIIGIWSIILSNSIYIFGRFYNIIIVEMIMFYSHCITMTMLIIIYMYYNNLQKQDKLFEPLLPN
jgi:hypothetical protein